MWLLFKFPNSQCNAAESIYSNKSLLCYFNEQINSMLSLLSIIYQSTNISLVSWKSDVFMSSKSQSYLPFLYRHAITCGSPQHNWSQFPSIFNCCVKSHEILLVINSLEKTRINVEAALGRFALPACRIYLYVKCNKAKLPYVKIT